MKTHSRYETARKILLFWCLFIGIGAVAGSVGMFVAPDGSVLSMQPMLPYFQALPFAKYLFQDYIFPGIALLLVNGIPNLIAALLLFRKKRLGVVLGGLFGVTLMLWICIQFIIFPMNFLSTAYFIFGIFQAATAASALVFERQEAFCVNVADYPNIGRDKRRLVVYFSRMGYTKKAACEAANETGAALYEIVATEHTQGTTGFWWCGRFGMHRWPMKIKTPEIDWAAYEKITICSPVWVFDIAAPVKSFCMAAKGHVKSADYVLLHHMNCYFARCFLELDRLLGIKHDGERSIRCRIGQFSEIKRSKPAVMR